MNKDHILKFILKNEDTFNAKIVALNMYMRKKTIYWSARQKLELHKQNIYLISVHIYRRLKQNEITNLVKVSLRACIEQNKQNFHKKIHKFWIEISKN